LYGEQVIARQNRRSTQVTQPILLLLSASGRGEQVILRQKRRSTQVTRPMLLLLVVKFWEKS
jgi:hypothetical protein